MELREIMAQDRRLAILRFLSEAEGYALNASVLTTAVAGIKHMAFRDVIESDLADLERWQLVTLEKIGMPSGSLVCATLTVKGLEVAQGRTHPNVARPKPKA